MSDAPWELLARHLAGEASAAERAALRRWVQADPRHQQLLATVTRDWEQTSAVLVTPTPAQFSPADVTAAWQRVLPLLGSPPAAPVARPLKWTARLGWVPAATTLGVASLGALLLLRRADAGPADATYTSADHPQLVRLPDSSRVWLNAHSRLRYQAASAGPRTAQLTGEGYFAIAPRASQPFVVNTTGARIRSAAALPAAFNVRAYAAEDSVDVSVTQGAVWLLRPAHADSLALAAGWRAAAPTAKVSGQFTASSRRLALRDHNIGVWHTDTLRFREVPVAEVVRTLQVTYGIHVRLEAAALGRCRFTGTFAHPRPGRVLAVLAAATASRLQPDGRGGYRLSGAGCPVPVVQPDSAASARRP